MKILLSCVNSSVSLVGYDTEPQKPFWYCPGNVLRTCGICADATSLRVASDNGVTVFAEDGIRNITLPGPHENLAHSIKEVGGGLWALADTGNSRVLFLSQDETVLSCSPVDQWQHMPLDAIHLNDILPWRDGLLISAFSHQPFRSYKTQWPGWNRQGLGVIFYLRRKGKMTMSTIVASGLNCPHSLVEHDNHIYCCSSSTGQWYRFAPADNGGLNFDGWWQVTLNHFLRGALRVEDGWLLGGSSRRHMQEGEAGGMVLFHLKDSGEISTHTVACLGEIYDILPWNSTLMGRVASQVMTLPDLPLEGTFPQRCDPALAI